MKSGPPENGCPGSRRSGPPPRDAQALREDAPPEAEPFDRWLPRHVVEAVRRGEVPEAVLRRLRAILHGRDDATADLPRFASVWEIADFAGIPPEQAVAVFRALQQLPGVAPERLARRIAKAWLELQRQRHRPASRPGESG